jgi:hypothetical protein
MLSRNYKSSLVSLAFSLLVSALVACITLANMSKNNMQETEILAQKLVTAHRARLESLWDFEEGGPTAADDAGENYNPVVLDHFAGRNGYPSIDNGWQRWGCSYNSLEDMYPCPRGHGQGQAVPDTRRRNTPDY